MYFYSVLISVKREHRIVHHETYIDSKIPLTEKEVSDSVMAKIPVDIRYLTRVIDIETVDPKTVRELRRYQSEVEHQEQDINIPFEEV